jgi:hypothetical protein
MPFCDQYLYVSTMQKGTQSIKKAQLLHLDLLLLMNLGGSCCQQLFLQELVSWYLGCEWEANGRLQVSI